MKKIFVSFILILCFSLIDYVHACGITGGACPIQTVERINNTMFMKEQNDVRSLLPLLMKRKTLYPTVCKTGTCLKSIFEFQYDKKNNYQYTERINK